MSDSVWIGVDGGGTHSALVAVDREGTVLGTSECAGLNFYTIGAEEARSRLCAAVAGLLGAIGARDYAVLSVGSSALDGRADAALTRSFAGASIPAERLELCGDVFMAEQGASLGRTGIAVVSGTGAMVLGVDAHGEEHIAGGWGYRLGDPGSAYGVAVEALRAVFAADEGLAPETALREAALRRFGARSVRELIGPVYAEDCMPADIAAFAREVAQLAEAGEATARDILERQYLLLARQTARIWDECPGTVFLWGGMFAHNAGVRALFCELTRARRPAVAFGEAALPPQLGAVIYAMKRRGELSDGVLENMRETWRKWMP